MVNRPSVVDLARDLVRESVKLGFIEYRRIFEPDSDKIRERAAIRYIKAQGFDGGVLSKWVSSGLVRRRKDPSKGGNSPVWYKLTEIQSAIVAVRTKEALDDWLPRDTR